MDIKIPQIWRVLDALSDKKPHTVPDIIKRVYGVGGPSSARLASRISELRINHGWNIRTSHVHGTVWSYQLIGRLPSRKAGGKKAK